MPVKPNVGICSTYPIFELLQTDHFCRFLFNPHMKHYLRRFTFTYLFSVSFLLSTQAQIITTIVSGTNVNDGGPATNAALNAPTGLAFDGAGNLYITDSYEHTIRKIDGAGNITTIAGTGTRGSGGDSGPATQAQFYSPTGIAIDASGIIYVADKINNRIRKIAANGIIMTIAGTGSYGFSGDGGPAISAQLAYPTDVYVSPTGELLIADLGNRRVRKIAVDGTITTVAGNGISGFSGDGGMATSASFQSPNGLTSDADGNLYIADSFNNRIRKVDANGIITTIAGNGAIGSAGDDGLATQAAIGSPSYLTFDASGVLYVTQASGWIRRIDTNGVISTIAGTGTVDFSGDGGPATQATLNNPAGIRVNAAGDIVVADKGNYRVRRISGGTISTIAGGFTGESGPATNGYLRSADFIDTPTNTSVDKLGNVYVTDRYSHQIKKVTPNGIISTLTGTGVIGYTGDGGPAIQAKLAYPRGVTTDQVGNLYLVDQYNSRIRKIDANQIITTVAGSGKPNFIGTAPFVSSAELYNPSTLPIDQAGNLYVFSACCVMKVAPAGTITIVAGTTAGTGFSGDGGPAVNAQLSSPNSAVIDNNGVLYIADGSNNRVRKVDTNGIITTIAGTGLAGYGAENVPAVSTPIRPSGIARDIVGNLYVSESDFSRVRKIDRNGTISTIAGSGIQGFTGDNGPATNARLKSPSEITLDAAGNLYIADTGNKRVRKVTYPVQTVLTAVNACPITSVTLTAVPTGPGFSYQFGPGATQIGNTNQATVSTAGVYSVTVSTSLFGSPPGIASISIGGPGEIYTLRDGSWNDPTVWSCGTIPTAGQSARIGHMIDIPDDYQATAGSIRYNDGGRVWFNARSQLKLMD